MAHEKQYTAKEAALAVLKKAEEVLKKSELFKAEKSKHDRCVEHVKANSPEVKNPHAVCVAEGVKPAKWGKSEPEWKKPEKDADQHAEGKGPKGEIHPPEQEQAPSDNVEAIAPQETAGNQQPGTIPPDDTKGGFVPVKSIGSAKLSKFMERIHAKRKTKQGVPNG